ncbi:MAG: endo-1,4-beta-xylanase, partial [Oscillospiraceae bacterium]|nr:endo-1,4-beta-xylanase [Oscillospiraceae bacterium]
MQNFKKICTLATSLVLAAGTLASFPASSVRELSAETTYVSNDFDVEYEGWCNVGVNTKLTADEQNPHEGTRSMLVSNRLSAEDGASSAKGLWLWGGENYNYSVFVKHSSEGEENFKLSLSYLLEDGETWKDTVIAEKSAASGEWTELEGKFRAPEGATEFIVRITTDSTCDFWFDDFTASGKKSSSRTVSAAEKGLKDEFANYFRVGNILNGGTVKNSAITAMYLRDFNSIECENETKPDATIVRGGNHSNTNIQVSLNSCAAIADFCSKNGLGFRGHTLVWHSQMPQFFFKDNFQD